MSKVSAGDRNNGKLFFMCPACDMMHAIDRRWEFNGHTDRPTFSPSILVRIPGYSGISDYKCHSFVRDGKIIFLDDCSHSMRGETVELPEVPND